MSLFRVRMSIKKHMALLWRSLQDEEENLE